MPDNMPRYDSRSDLGQGKASGQTFDAPRMLQDVWPYQEDDYSGVEMPEEEPEWDIDDHIIFLNKTNLNYLPSDFLAVKQTSPGRYGAGAVKTMETTQMVVNPKSMTPVHDLYKGRGKGFGMASLPNAGPTDGFRTVTRPTGDRKGWSMASVLLNDDDEAWEKYMEEYYDD